MTRTARTVSVLALAALAFAAGRTDLARPASSLAAQPPGDEMMTPEAQARMQAMMKAATPGEHHAILNAFLGDWHADVRFRMAPGQDMTQATGTVSRKWILDGHFIREDVRATSDMGEFKGMGILGYNNTDGQYEFAWYESMDTAMYFETGQYNPDTKTITTLGSRRDPATGRLIQTRSVVDMSNPDRHVSTGYATGPDGAEYVNFEGVFERNGGG